MMRFALGRLVRAIPVLLISSMVIFLVVYLIPGDPALARAGADATEDQLDQLRVDFGLDKPNYVQYAIWLGKLLRGDLGTSYITDRPVSSILAERIPVTLELALAAMLIAVVGGILLGVLAAVREGRFTDYAVNGLNSFMIAIPNFWVGILMIIIFSLWLGVLPPGGRAVTGSDPGEQLQYLVLPAVALSINTMAAVARFTRSAVVQSLHEDYITTVMAKGVSWHWIVAKHALRNASIPVLTVIGIYLGRMLGGSLIIESVFAWPGVGTLLVQSILTRDYSVVQMILLFMVAAFIVVNLVVDISYGFLDPRMRDSKVRA